MPRKLFIILLCLAPLVGIAQKRKKKSKKEKAKVALVDRVARLFGTYQTKDTLLIYKKEKDRSDTTADVPLRKKKNVFFGLKTRREYTVAKAGGRTVIEDFYILPDPVAVDPYVVAIYRHDRDRRRVTRTRPKKSRVSRVLHGPYKKLIDDKLVEEGMYFYGTKHQRWVKLTRQNKLISKAHYHKGWYRDSQIDYYDGAGKQRIKSVMPIQYGKKEGVFILFHSSGKMALFPRRQGQAGIFVPSPWRGIAARYKRLAVNYLAMPGLVAVAVCSPVVRFFFSLALKSVTCVTARSRWV